MKKIVKRFFVGSLIVVLLIVVAYLIFPETLTNVTPEKFGSRVTHYYAEYYVVQHTFNGGVTWSDYTSCYINPDIRFSSLNKRDFPYLTDDLETAKNLAKSLTAESVRKHNKEEDERWYRYNHSCDTTITYMK